MLLSGKGPLGLLLGLPLGLPLVWPLGLAAVMAADLAADLAPGWPLGRWFGLCYGRCLMDPDPFVPVGRSVQYVAIRWVEACIFDISARWL